MKSKYPKIISHHGFVLTKHAVGVYEYRSFNIVSDVVYGGFRILGSYHSNFDSRFHFVTYGSLVELCRRIDNYLNIPVLPSFPIDIVTINYKSI